MTDRPEARPMPPAWVIFVAAAALVAGAGTGTLLGVLGTLMAPPALVLLYRRGPAWGAMAVGAGMALLLTVTRSPAAAIVAAMPAGISGLLLARGIFSRTRPLRTAWIASLPYLGLSVFEFFRVSVGPGRAEEAARAVESIRQFYGAVGFDGKTIDSLAGAAEFAVVLMPAGDYAVLLGITVMVYGFSASLLRRYGGEAEELPRLTAWRTPFGLVWVFAAGLAGTLLGHTPAREIGANLLLLCSMVYLVQGVGVLAWQFRKRKIPYPVRILFFAVAVLLVFPFFLALTVGTGLFDTWFDFRRLERAPKEPEAS